MDETRHRAAQEELGRRHPYLTIYGRRIGVTAVLAVGGFGLWWAGQVGALGWVAVAVVVGLAGTVAWVLR